MLQYCLSTAGSQPVEDVARANDKGASVKNESNSSYKFTGEGDRTSPRFFQLYMGHDDDIVSAFAPTSLQMTDLCTDYQSTQESLQIWI